MKRRNRQTTLQDLQNLMEEFSLGQIELQKGHKKLEEALRAETEERKKALAEAAAEAAADREKASLDTKELKAELRAIARDNKRRTDALEELFTGQWGKLMESLVKGDLISLLNERGIHVNHIAQERLSIFEGKEYEFDIIAIDGESIVVVEVKTTLRLKDIDVFIKKTRNA